MRRLWGWLREGFRIEDPLSGPDVFMKGCAAPRNPPPPPRAQALPPEPPARDW